MKRQNQLDFMGSLPEVNFTEKKPPVESKYKTGKPMTVAALIKDLESLPQNANVFRFIPITAKRVMPYEPFTRQNIQFDGPNIIIY